MTLLCFSNHSILPHENLLPPQSLQNGISKLLIKYVQGPQWGVLIKFMGGRGTAKAAVPCTLIELNEFVHGFFGDLYDDLW